MTEARWIWLDLEMTGLRPDVDQIIEIATVLTDTELNVVATGPNLVIHHPDDMLASLMDNWNLVHHGRSGLLDEVHKSTISTAVAEDETLNFLQQQGVEKNSSPMCGNTICTDRRFLYHHMPRLEEFFHYRHLDVSSVRELARRWKPEIMDSVPFAGKAGSALEDQQAHRAVADVLASIEELRYYKRFLLDI